MAKVGLLRSLAIGSVLLMLVDSRLCPARGNSYSDAARARYRQRPRQPGARDPGHLDDRIPLEPDQPEVHGDPVRTALLALPARRQVAGGFLRFRVALRPVIRSSSSTPPSLSIPCCCCWPGSRGADVDPGPRTLSAAGSGGGASGAGAELDLERVICRLADLEEYGSRGFTVGGGDWPLRGFVVRCGNELRGFVNRCPHAGHPLDLRPHRFLTPDQGDDSLLFTRRIVREGRRPLPCGSVRRRAAAPVPLEVIGDLVLIARGCGSRSADGRPLNAAS